MFSETHKKVRLGEKNSCSSSKMLDREWGKGNPLTLTVHQSSNIRLPIPGVWTFLSLSLCGKGKGKQSLVENSALE